MKNSLGKIISINKDLYSVLCGTEVFPCSVRGKLKNIKLTVGDNVKFDKDNKTIEGVLDRKNTLIRPLVSNIDKLFIVVSSMTPDFSSYLLDKFVVLAVHNNITPVIVITKLDLVDRKTKKDILNTLKYYKKLGIHVYKNTNTFMIKRELKNSVSALGGQTGAGKSTLLNKLDKSLNLKTGEVSIALGRGKHTTRLVELMPLCKGLIADTPGFSSLELDLTENEIRDAFTEFGFNCKYNTCNHTHEKGCDVIKRVKEGKILESRYNNYIKLIKEDKHVSKW